MTSLPHTGNATDTNDSATRLPEAATAPGTGPTPGVREHTMGQ